MAHADKKHMGAGAKGKGDGSGAMTELDDETLPENMVLSNRDKAQHSRERGLDGKAVQSGQYHDHAANRLQETARSDEPAPPRPAQPRSDKEAGK